MNGNHRGIVLCCALLGACLQPWAESGQSDVPIIGGVIDRDDPAVVRMSARQGSISWGCTGSLIAPSVVLTAAHCVEDVDSRTSIDVFFGTFSDSSSGRWEPVSAYSIDPLYNTRNIGAGHDIALLFLADPVLDIAPVVFNRAPLTPDMRGARVRIVGFGNTNGWSGTGSGTKRQVTTSLNYWDDGIINVGETGRATCQGDSGGPTFLMINGVETTIGTTSFGDFGCPGAAFMSRVDIAAEWIDAQIAQHGGPSCTPECSGRSCGDDGCGGSCGTCNLGACDAQGQCVCTPDCSGQTCGDDGCGGSCGTCGPGTVCNNGQCECQPMCDGVQCGDDGCGGSCGSCGQGECDVDGQCVCTPDCSGRSCGDDGCGGSCGACGNGLGCSPDGQCTCAPSCDGVSCGDDGCGGSCGACGPGTACDTFGQCVCEPDCSGRVCGDDGCGGSCGGCSPGESCDSQGQCAPSSTPPSACDTNGGWEAEPNNTPSSSSGFCSSGQVYGTVEYSGDVDWFHLTTQSAGRLQLTLLSPPGGFGMTLYRVESGVAQPVQTALTQSPNNIAQLDVQSASAGEYRVEVFGLNGISYWDYGYSLQVTTTP